MQAINHLATALIIKKAVPATPLLPALLATEAIEFLWVGLNFLDIESVSIMPPGTHVSNVHLTHMPFSHSVAGATLCALVIGIVALWKKGRSGTAVALALAAAVFSHILLDLAVHEPDILLAPGLTETRYGSNFIGAFPFTELLVETIYGLLCWKIFGGSRALLAVFLAAFFLAAPSYLPASFGLGTPMTAATFPAVILVQILLTLLLVFIFARKRPATP